MPKMAFNRVRYETVPKENLRKINKKRFINFWSGWTLCMINCCYFVLVFAHSIFEFNIFHDFLTQLFGWNENRSETVAMIRISLYQYSLFFHSVNGVIINSHLNKFSSNFVFCHSIVCCVHDFHFNSSCSSSEFSALKSRNLCYENDEAVTVNEFTFFIAFKLNHFNNM